MTEKEAQEAIKDIPVGSKLQLIKKNGDIVEVSLMSHKVSGEAKKNYDNLEVPELPPALIVQGGTRFGNFRVDVDDIVKIARIG
ncbi:MAG: hypothetical protein R3345_06890 [Fulvivirga sp.]|nr:hypothetical protein [Fulvivirga sp.]